MNPIADCPQRLSAEGSSAELSWTLDAGLRGSASAEDGDQLLIPADRAPADALPVYRSASGVVAVATGRLFVRLDTGKSLDIIDDALAALGLEIIERPHWAPHAGWVAARDGRPCTALTALPLLRRVEGIAHAEAQLLMSRQTR